MAKRKSSSKLITILVIAVVVIIIIAIVGKQTGVIGQPDSTKVETAEAEKRSIIEKVNASGTVQPVVEVKLSPDVAGEIIALNVEEGDSVQKGDLLIKILPDNFINALERAKANLNQQRATLAQTEASFERAKAQFIQAEQNFNRQKKLFDKNVISEADFETAKANFEVAKSDRAASAKNVSAARYTVQSARATVDEAAENLSRTEIYAPVDGTVSKLNVELGERVVGTQQMAGTELLRIANLNNMEVRVDVNENDIIRIDIGDTASIEVDSYTFMEKKFTGKVTAIANTANDKASPDAVTEFEVKVKILNESYADLIKDSGSPFRPGMTASVEIMTEKMNNAISVPLSSVTLRSPISKDSTDVNKRKSAATASLGSKEEQDEVVFVVKEDNKIEQRKVITGISDFEFIEIKEGLKPGETVVKGPFLAVSKTLEDGDLVESRNKPKEGKETED